MSDTKYLEPATGPQIGYLRKLLEQREVPADLAETAETAGTKRAVSELIGQLKRLPFKGNGGSPKVDVKEGFYVDGEETVYQVVKAKSTGNLYAKVLNGTKWEYAKGAIYRLQEGNLTPLSLEVAASYGKKTGNCMICGRELTKQVSIDAGIGPVCSSKF
jgi:hypothetical protein